jgi:hypothetical protein
MDALCATGMPWAISLSSPAMGDKEGNDISGEGGKDARDTSSADNGIIDSGGEDKEWDVVPVPVDGSFGEGGPSSSGGEKRRLGCLAGLSAVATERLRRSFSPSCHLRTPTLALALARRARETALRPKDTNPSRGLTLFDLVPVL